MKALFSKRNTRIITIILAIFILSTLFYGNPLQVKAANTSCSYSKMPYDDKYPVCWSSWKRTKLPTNTEVLYGYLVSYTMYDWSACNMYFCYIKGIGEKQDAEFFSQCELEDMMKGQVDTYVYYIFLDHGLFTEYCDTFKAMGWIDPSYQLPQTYYQITSATDMCNYTSECPEINYYQALPEQPTTTGVVYKYPPFGQPQYKSDYEMMLNELYIPKFLRDQGKTHI